MSMFGEVATETTVHEVLRRIDIFKKENPSDVKLLNSLARDIITHCFDWDIPDWARKARLTIYTKD